MLPLAVLKTAQGHAVLIELKSGETYNGHLVMCDTWMNVHLREVICTSKDGDRFWRLPEVYLRGNNIKYLRLPPEVLELAKEAAFRRDEERPQSGARGRGRGRGGRGGRGEGAGGRGGRGEGGWAGRRGEGGDRGRGRGRGRGGAGGRAAIAE